MHDHAPAAGSASRLLSTTQFQFTATFIYGSWNGKFIFNEPMITREFLLTKPDVVLPVGTAAQYSPAGYYPGAYRIQYDAQAREYRVALAQLAWR